jgi:hypothetical protein
MKKLFSIIFVIIISSLPLFSQNDEQHVWKVVEASDGSKFWYDASELDTMKSDKFNIWILETYKPPAKFESIDGEVYRSKTLYCINITTVKYGILKIRYYDVNNKEIYNHDYDVPPPPEIIRYTYPITENSMLHYLLKELFGKDKAKTNQEF